LAHPCSLHKFSTPRARRLFASSFRQAARQPRCTPSLTEAGRKPWRAWEPVWLRSSASGDRCKGSLLGRMIARSVLRPLIYMANDCPLCPEPAYIYGECSPALTHYSSEGAVAGASGPLLCRPACLSGESCGGWGLDSAPYLLTHSTRALGEGRSGDCSQSSARLGLPPEGRLCA